MGTKHTEEDLDLLTPEELAGLNDTDVVDEGDESVTITADADDEAAAAAAKKADEDKVDHDAAKAKADEEAAAAKAKAEADGADTGNDEDDAAAKAAKEAEEAAAAEDAKARAKAERDDIIDTGYKADPESKNKLADIDAQLLELRKKFDDGEMLATDLHAEQAPLEEQKRIINENLFRETLSVEAQIARWTKKTVPDFLDDHPEYKKGSSLFNSLNAEVKRLQAETDNPLNPAFLEQAHLTLQNEFRAANGLPPLTAKAQAPAKREIPPSLNRIPAADMNDAVDGGDFAYLDRLADSNPEKFEEAMAALSEDKREAYLAQ